MSKELEALERLKTAPTSMGGTDCCRKCKAFVENIEGKSE